MLRPAVLLLALPAFCLALSAAPSAQAGDADAEKVTRLLGRGVNFGNALEAPREGEWGMVIRPEYFRLVREAGFRTVRLPVRWSAHAAPVPPYAVEPAFFRRIDELLDQAEAEPLNLVLNCHHYDEVFQEPDAHEARLAAIWRQIAERYRGRSDRLVFELLNEPHGRLDDTRWNRMLRVLLAEIRASDPRRWVMIGPADWNGIGRIDRLDLPRNDRRLIATVHYYLPFQFTHQGAEWAQGSDRWLGRKWEGTDDERTALARDFDRAAVWAKREGRPMFLGEFGAYHRAEMPSRARWTAAVARAAEERGFSWAYWEFGAGFGVYDRERRAWRPELLGALVPDGKRPATGP